MRLNETNFLAWLKERGEVCGKVKLMKEICEQFPEESFWMTTPWPPFELGKYNSKAAILMNKLKRRAKIETRKKGRSWCFKVTE